ncbi:hypothetical protein SCALIN_C04_0039 [Candidatus Scalindua japonica]|uniref:HYR domain-containing protein n=1 Tax=Candidatus Scalindua japonica TaxID=1284222 RepID=A0A286TUM6_9BACT|nr:MopE-related protein [Candidatus Scalindua japonica]GAX59551.1 hypothetical protein SCALIN_C04_0039 [Candidatus Scalindua japonica]
MSNTDVSGTNPESLTIGNYQLVSKTRAGRTDYDYTFRADITNAGTEDALSVSADLTSLVATTTVIEGHLTFSDITAGATDTFTVRVDRRYPYNEANLSWAIDATFAGGGADDDGDGHIAVEDGGDDCDDTNPNIHPGAAEVCDGLDNDCDGQEDDGLTIDSDGDGHTTKGSCSSTKDDCDDSNPEVYPGATEILNNGIDDNCNGEVDEDTVPPKVTITSPITFTTVGSSPITVEGTVVDPDATLTVNGVNASIGGGTFSVDGITLKEGGNIITATAIDTANNVGTAHVNIHFDSTPPNENITFPQDGYVATASPITVTGSINDIVKGTVNVNNATVEVNGISASVSNNTFKFSFPETTGDFTFDFTFEATYSVTVPAEARIVLMHFLSRHLDSTTARSMALKLQNLQGRALEGISDRLKADIVNFIPLIDSNSGDLSDNK